MVEVPPPVPEGPVPEASVEDAAPEAPPVPEMDEPRRPLANVELCAFCQCPNVEDAEHGPMVKMNCIHAWHRDCLQEWMDCSDLPFEQACPMRCHLGLVGV